MPSVVKHSYLRGAQMKSRAAAHINYILYRREDGREERNARQMRANDRDDFTGYQLKKEINQLRRNDVVHKLILSPGRNDVNTKQYVREVMDELGRAKGLELRYGYVEHENTAHKHVHVVLLGRDVDGNQVRLDKDDHMRLRAFGDRYLEREHGVERVMDRDMENFCRARNLNPMFEKERGELFFERLYKQEKKKERDPSQNMLEWEKFNNDWKKFIEDREGMEPGSYLGKSKFHDLGRMSDFMGLMKNNEQRKEWSDLGEERPDMKELADERVAQIDEFRTEMDADLAAKTKRNPFPELQRISEQLSYEAKQFQKLMEHGLSPYYSHTGIELNHIDDKDKIEAEGRTYTKYDTKEELLILHKYLKNFTDAKLEPRDYGKLWEWIGAKERFGEDCYGEPPGRRLEEDKDIGPAFKLDDAEGSLDKLDDFVGLGKSHDLDRDSPLLGEPEAREPNRELDLLVGMESRSQEIEVIRDTADRAIIDTPREPEPEIERDRDDGSDLFSQGIY